MIRSLTLSLSWSKLSLRTDLELVWREGVLLNLALPISSVLSYSVDQDLEETYSDKCSDTTRSPSLNKVWFRPGHCYTLGENGESLKCRLFRCKFMHRILCFCTVCHAWLHRSEQSLPLAGKRDFTSCSCLQIRCLIEAGWKWDRCWLSWLQQREIKREVKAAAHPCSYRHISLARVS